tara:strand:+ start:3094 stop:4110 length:1017 start_codon:yes stop_codon:yes gene_type:complete
MIGKKKMDNMIETRNAADAPLESAEVPVGNAGIDTTAGEGNGLFPQGDDAITETIGVTRNVTDNREGLPSGLASPITETDNTAPVQEAAPTEEPLAKEDPNRMQYWQSQADKAINENRAMSQELEYYKNTLGPINDAIQSDPELLDRLEAKTLSNAPQQGSPAQGNQVGPLQKPEMPQKPHSYNEVDAYNNPESESFNYRLAKDQYRDDMLDYYGAVDAQRAQIAQQQMAKQKESMVLNQAHSYAQQNYGMDARQATDFVRWANNPKNVTMDHLAKIYQMSTSPSQQVQASQEKVQQMQLQKQRAEIPRTAVVQQGNPAPQITDEQAFSASLIGKNKR